MSKLQMKFLNLKTMEKRDKKMPRIKNYYIESPKSNNSKYEYLLADHAIGIASFG